MWERALVIGIAAFALAQNAAAEAVGTVLAEAGLLGRWADDCSRGPSTDNMHLIYKVEPSGEVTLTWDEGPGITPKVDVILSARKIASDRIAYQQQDRANGERLDIELVITARHIQFWSSRRPTGEVLVREGKFNDGKPSLPAARCD